MSLNICQLSGTPVEDPVVSIKSGHIFSRRLIEKHIELTQTCPMTQQPLQLSDLIPVQRIFSYIVNSTLIPRAPGSTSISGLLTQFQNEWDSLVLETFTVKEQLQMMRLELSHALYQHDAACRVIARLVKERDEARQQYQQGRKLEKLQGSQSMDVEEQHAVERERFLPETLVNEITDLAFQLNSQRKEKKKLKEKAFENYKDEQVVFQLQSIVQFKQILSVPLHATTKKGINCLDACLLQENLLCTGGNDNNALVFDKNAQKVISTLSGHKKRINDISFVNSDQRVNVLVCSEDASASLFDCSSAKGKITYKIQDHKLPITACDIHPLGYLAVVCSLDEQFSFHDLNQGKQLKVVKLAENSAAYTSLKIHPDGHVMALGSQDGYVKIWNLTDDSLLENMQAQTGAADLMDFSQNGYYFTTGSKNQKVVNIWDLRNQIRSIKTFNLESLGCLSFDPTGQFLAIGQEKQIKVIAVKNLESFTSFEAHSSIVSDLRWGNYSQNITSVGQDRQLSIFE